MNNPNKSALFNSEDANPNAGMDTVTSRHAAGSTPSRRAVHSDPFTIDPSALFRHTAVITVIGRVEDWSLEWAGRIRCTLCLSIGDVQLTANRDSLPLDIQNGSWVRARLLLGPGSPGNATRLLGVTVVRPEQSAPTSWTPTVLFHRYDHMRRLRVLISQLEPGLQAIFMAVMVNAQMQHGFFYRIAATDHHTYPGGLFDHSIEAAELAYQQEHLGPRERGLSALTCLLFDLGKVSDDQIRTDRPRCGSTLEPHADTARHLADVLDSVARREPELVESLHALLARTDSKASPSWPSATEALRQCVHQALQASWQLDKHISDDATKTGAQE